MTGEPNGNTKDGQLRKLRSHMGIKWQVFGYMAAFAALMLMLLWICQVVLLGAFYRDIKTNTVKNACESIIQDYSQSSNIETLEESLNNLSNINELNVVIISKNGIIYSQTEAFASGVIRKMSYSDFRYLVEAAQANGGSLYYSITYEGPQGLVVRDEHGQRQYGLKLAADDFIPSENLLFMEIAANQQGENFAVLINSALAPVDATVQTLRSQLMLIMMIMIIFAIGLAFVLSRRISRPITKINRTSKELAKGNFEIDFSNDDYKEVMQLGRTLNYATAELAKSESFQREIIANVSHDLRTPLTMITGYAEIMRDIPGENTPENVQVIIDEANRLTSLVNDALDLSKLQSNNLQLQQEEYNLTSSIRTILQRFAKLTADRGYQLDFQYDREVMVFADEIKISQVIYNLINNAITYIGEDKTVIVRQSVAERLKQEKKKQIRYTVVKLEIIDHGEGIEADKLQDIWQRYYKLDKNHRRSQVGTGLGLSIVRSVLELHQAAYGVESEVGQGSNFWFELPAAQLLDATPVLKPGSNQPV